MAYRLEEKNFTAETLSSQSSDSSLLFSVHSVPLW